MISISVSKFFSFSNTNDYCNRDDFVDEVLNTKGDSEEKKMTDLSQLIMEKLKFLSDGKGAVAPVQVMAIQIEVKIDTLCMG